MRPSGNGTGRSSHWNCAVRSGECTDYLLLCEKKKHAVCPGNEKTFPLDKRISRRIFEKMFPHYLQRSLYRRGKYDDQHCAGQTDGGSHFFSGFANAATVVVGKEVGAGHHETAYQRAVRLVYLCSGFIGIACLTLNLVHNPLLHMLGLSGESYRIGSGMLLIYGIAAVIRMGNWAHNDTFRSAGDAAFGSTLEITFMYLLVLPCVYLANFRFHAPFLAVFALCYVDEPIRYCIMQVHMYFGKWIKPVSEAGKRTIEEFRRNRGI